MMDAQIRLRMEELVSDMVQYADNAATKDVPIASRMVEYVSGMAQLRQWANNAATKDAPTMQREEGSV